MSFFYLFIPTWIFTILIYTLLAARYGAKKSYPEEEEQEKRRNENMERFQEQKAQLEPEPIADNSIFTKILKSIAIIVLIITLVLACIVLFGSSNEALYIENREIFYRYAFICTLIYFITAYMASKRNKLKNHNKK